MCTVHHKTLHRREKEKNPGLENTIALRPSYVAAIHTEKAFNQIRL